MKYLLDTNVCIYLMKGETDILKRYIAKRDSGIGISSITVAELYYGVFSSDRPDRNGTNLANFLVGPEILEFGSAAAFEYGRIRAFLRKKGTTISQTDMMIAAHAKSGNLILVTNNVSEFERIDGLRLETWLTKAAGNAAYLNKLDRATEQLSHGEGNAHELIEVDDL